MELYGNKRVHTEEEDLGFLNYRLSELEKEKQKLKNQENYINDLEKEVDKDITDKGFFLKDGNLLKDGYTEILLVNIYNQIYEGEDRDSLKTDYIIVDDSNRDFVNNLLDAFKSISDDYPNYINACESCKEYDEIGYTACKTCNKYVPKFNDLYEAIDYYTEIKKNLDTDFSETIYEDLFEFDCNDFDVSDSKYREENGNTIFKSDFDVSNIFFGKIKNSKLYKIKKEEKYW